MVDKSASFKSAWICCVITLLFPSTMSGAGISGAELLSLLTQKDAISYASGYKVSFVMTMNADLFNPVQGIVVMDSEATWTAESFALKITYSYEKDVPVFAPLESGDYDALDYDEEGNLIVWRSLEKYILFAPHRNETIEKIKSFFVDPNGELVDKRGTQTLLHRFPIGSRDYTYEFNQFQLAAGRGFSRDLRSVMSVKTLPSGLVEVSAKARRGPAIQGTWQLTLDPKEDYLVTTGTFTRAGRDEPTIVVTSSGTVTKDELKIRKYGSFKYSNLLRLSIEVTDTSKVVGPNKLYDEVRSRLNSPLPAGAEIIDLRGDKRVVTTVE